VERLTAVPPAELLPATLMLTKPVAFPSSPAMSEQAKNNEQAASSNEQKTVHDAFFRIAFFIENSFLFGVYFGFV
jgi:hypothetical protein